MKDFFAAIFNIFKVLAKILGTLWTIVFNLLFFGGIALLAVTLFRSTETTIPADSILKLTLSGTIVEQRQEEAPFDDYLADFLGFSDQPGKHCCRTFSMYSITLPTTILLPRCCLISGLWAPPA